MSSTTHTGHSFAAHAPSDADGMAILGRTTHDLMGIRYDQGTGGNAPAATPAAPTAPATPTAPAQTQAPTTSATPAATPQAPAAETPPAVNPATGVAYTPAETQAYIANLRNESKTNREAREAAEADATAAKAQTAAVLAALGLNPDGTAAAKTPEQLTKELEARNSVAETTARENLVLRVTPKFQGDPDKMLDSRVFNTKLAALKSDDKDGVEALVSQWVTDHPEHKVTSAASASGSAPHTGTTPPTARKSMHDAVQAGIARKPNS